MKTVGIIAEYNPFHNGHAYQIAEARRLTGADCAVIVMSGDFVQRGAPAVFDKYTRTRAALLSGADLVFELPVYFATASAEAFAHAGVSMLTEMGVDYICFGSESGDISALSEIAGILAFEPDTFKAALSAELKTGKCFPAAREKALQSVIKDMSGSKLSEIMREPNNLLGIEYLKALKRLEKSGKKVPLPITVTRLGNYHPKMSANVTDTVLSRNSSASSQHRQSETQSFSSASALRLLLDHGSVSELIPHVPEEVFNIYSSHLALYNPVSDDSLSTLLSYSLLTTDISRLSTLAGWSEALANRTAELPKNLSFSKTAEALKSKNITLSRACRMLLALILKTDGNLLERSLESGVPYLRLLGMKEACGSVLKGIKKQSFVPVVNRPAPAGKSLEGDAKLIFEADIRAARLYDVLMKSKEPDEYQRGIIRL